MARKMNASRMSHHAITDEEMDDLRTLIRRLRGLGQTWRTVAEAVNEAGYRTDRGRKWTGTNLAARGFHR